VAIGDGRGALQLPAGEETPEEELARKEEAAVVAREIRRIPPLLRNALVLRDMQELPMGEIAERLGISVAAAKYGCRGRGRS
jgi:RNA polymerase sigma-70 factor (ECF subfamily)